MRQSILYDCFMTSMAGKAKVLPVRNRRDRKDFFQLPFVLYRNDTHWIPPVGDSIERELDPARNPYFAHSEREMFVARRGEAAVGRIVAVENYAYNERHRQRIAFFSHFECEDDPAAGTALFDAVRAWAKARNLEAIRGPLAPGLHGPCGILLEGHELPPPILTPWNPPYYRRLLEAAGLQKTKDSLAYRFTRESAANANLMRLDRLRGAAARRLSGLRLRALDAAGFTRDAAAIWALFEETRRDNRGTVPMSEAEIRHAIATFRNIADPRLVIMAEADCGPVGYVAALPDSGPALRRIRGRLWPFGWLTLALEQRRAAGMRVFGLGVLPRFRGSGVTAALLAEILRRGLDAGYSWAEASWIVEDNLPPRRLIEKTMKTQACRKYGEYEEVFSSSRYGARCRRSESAA